MDKWIPFFIVSVAAQLSFLLATPTTTSSLSMAIHDLNNTRTTHVVLTENVKTYWIRKPQDYTLLYVVVPIAIGTLLIVLVFFLWLFSERTEATEQFDYEELDDARLDEPIAGPSSHTSSFLPILTSPTHSVIVQGLLDVPYPNINEVVRDEEPIL